MHALGRRQGRRDDIIRDFHDKKSKYDEVHAHMQQMKAFAKVCVFSNIVLRITGDTETRAYTATQQKLEDATRLREKVASNFRNSMAIRAKVRPTE